MIECIIDLFKSLFKVVPPSVPNPPKPIVTPLDPSPFKMQKDDPEFLKIAFSFEGLKEPDPMIKEFHRAANFDGEYTDSWCSSFLCYCFEKAGIESVREPGAKTWLGWGQKIDIPKRGCVCIFWRDFPNSWKGHVGLFLKQDDKSIWLLSGNSMNSVRVAAYPKSQLLGYRV